MFCTRLLLLASILLANPLTLRNSHAEELNSVTNKRPNIMAKQVSGRRVNETRQREGAKLVEVTGRFVLVGERASFVPNDSPEGTSFRVLENLALERVLDNINESRSDRLWVVSGVLTEFRSVNHLLITKAVLQSPVAETAP